MLRHHDKYGIENRLLGSKASRINDATVESHVIGQCIIALVHKIVVAATCHSPLQWR